jgi:Transmembrane secretion effector
MRTLLRHREFRLLFIGQSLSAIGDRITLVALALYVSDIGTPTDVGLVLAAATLPMVALLLIAGVWADRLPRHKVMLTTDIARALVHGLLAALILSGDVQIWQIVVLEALYGTAEAFFRPAQTGLTPQTVPETQIQPAKAAMGMVDTLAGFLGPALATALVFGVGAGWAFAADAATFVVSAAFLAPMRPRPRGDVVERESLLTGMRQGWSEVRSRTWVWSTIALFSLAILCSFGTWSTLGPTVAENVYDDRAIYGIITACNGGGTLLGALMAFRWRPAYPLRTAFLWSLLWPAGIAAYALGAPLPLLVPLSVAGGIGIALFIVWWETALAERIPGHLLSRVTSYDWMGSLALLPLGYIASGPLGEAFGEAKVLGIGAAIAIAAQGCGLLVRQTRRLQNSATPVSGVEARA